MHIELTACEFGSSAATKETQEARTARLLQAEQQGVDARALRARRRKIAAGARPNPNFGAGEGVSLGVGL